MFLAPDPASPAGIPRGSFISCELSCFIGSRSFLTQPIFVATWPNSRHARSWSPLWKLCPSECWHYSHRLSATIQTCRLQLLTKTTRASPNSVYVNLQLWSKSRANSRSNKWDIFIDHSYEYKFCLIVILFFLSIQKTLGNLFNVTLFRILVILRLLFRYIYSSKHWTLRN